MTTGHMEMTLILMTFLHYRLKVQYPFPSRSHRLLWKTISDYRNLNHQSQPSSYLLSQRVNSPNDGELQSEPPHTCAHALGYVPIFPLRQRLMKIPFASSWSCQLSQYK